MRSPHSFFNVLAVASFALSLVTVASALGSSCTGPLGAGTSGPNDAFWLEQIKHQGTAPFNPDPVGYKVFRNVKDFGAVGDGITDDTAAINAAITTGSRCGGGGCPSSTVSPAIVYFPKGTYLISTPIIAYYYTQLIGDAKNPPTLLAAANFSGIAVIDADPYIAGGQFYINQNNFFRSVRNFVIDLRQVPATQSATGFHWQVSQATSLMNIVVEMSTDPNTAHQGLFMENGSGGFMGDLVFNGGKYGMAVGNQQFTVRNITVNNAQICISQAWNWAWTYQGVTFNNCQVGFDVVTNNLTASLAIIDAVITDTPIFLRTSNSSNGTLAGGSLVFNNVQLTNVPVAVGVVGGAVVLAGGTTTIESWAQGNVFKGTNSTGVFTQGDIPAPKKAPELLDDYGRIVGRTHPQYADYAVSQFVSVKDNGAKGDGITDDTDAINAVFAKYAGCKIIFFDAGVYVVTSTITIPAGSHVVGEAWTTLMGKGPAFQSQYLPQPVFKVGEWGSQGVMEITDMLFTTSGSTPGAIIVEWNVREPDGVQAGAGMWDSHIRVGGAIGTGLELAQCPRSGASGIENCFSDFLSLHLTPLSTAYLEGTWVWAADHDLDGDGTSQLNIYSGRGILSESLGPVWMIGTASEHHTLYQYNIVNANAHYMGMIQTETPYYQPTPVPPAPFNLHPMFKDPSFGPANPAAWALNVMNCQNILLFGAGLYSFFQDYDQACIATATCQSQLLNVDSDSTINVYSLATVATTYQLSVNQVGIINQANNTNGFSSTVTSWTRNRYSSAIDIHAKRAH